MSGSADFWSNAIHIDGLDDANHLLHVAKGNFPTHLILTFLHELSHAWLFSSPFGDAIAALNFRLRSAPERATLDELIKLHCALEFYRPIVEGHALFSEYYSGIGEEDELTPVTTLVLHGFAADRELIPKGIETPDQLFSLYNTRLGMMRNRFSSVDKLRCLYNHTGEYSSIYLVGFHAVRSLYFILTSGGVLRSPDTFLLLMYEVFFKDKTVIAKLLDSSVNSKEFRECIINHLNGEVLPFLASSGAVELISQYRQLWSKAKSHNIYYETPSVSYNIDVDLREVIGEFVEETRRVAGCSPKWIDYYLMKRQYSILVRRPVMLQISDGTMSASFIDAEGRQMLPIHPCVGDLKDGPAELIVLISVLSSLWVSFVGQGPNRIGVYHLHSPRNNQIGRLIHKKELEFLCAAYEALLRCDDIVFPEMTASKVNKGGEMWHGINPEKISGDARLFWFYWCSALPLLSTDWSSKDDERLWRAFEEIERNGLFQHTETGSLAARTLAILSIAYVQGDNSQVADDMMEEHGIDPQAGLDAIIQRSKELGLPILAARRRIKGTVEGLQYMSCFF